MSETVKVRLVWPESRGPKNDCRGQTSVVWAGRGDVQDYPVALWPKLAPHPDVWELVTKVHEVGYTDPEFLERQAQRERAKGLDSALPPELSAEAVQEIKDKGAETATDVVVVAVPKLIDAEALAAMTDEEVHAAAKLRGFTLHPRLNAVNLRARFLELQELDRAPAGA